MTITYVAEGFKTVLQLSSFTTSSFRKKKQYSSGHSLFRKTEVQTVTDLTHIKVTCLLWRYVVCTADGLNWLTAVSSSWHPPLYKTLGATELHPGSLLWPKKQLTIKDTIQHEEYELRAKKQLSTEHILQHSTAINSTPIDDATMDKRDV